MGIGWPGFEGPCPICGLKFDEHDDDGACWEDEKEDVVSEFIILKPK